MRELWSRTHTRYERDMMRTAMVIAAVLAGIVGASGFLAAQVPSGSADKGEAIYQAHCVRCHGTHGDGRGPDAKDLVVAPQDFHEPQSRDRSDFELLVAISNGVLFSPMHSFRGKLTDEQMLDVLSYIRAISPPDSIS